MTDVILDADDFLSAGEAWRDRQLREEDHAGAVRQAADAVLSFWYAVGGVDSALYATSDVERNRIQTIATAVTGETSWNSDSILTVLDTIAATLATESGVQQPQRQTFIEAFVDGASLPGKRIDDLLSDWSDIHGQAEKDCPAAVVAFIAAKSYLPASVIRARLERAGVLEAGGVPAWMHSEDDHAGESA